MNNKQLFSKFLAITLVITLIFSVFSVSAGAVSADEKSNSQNANIQDNLSVSGTNSLGTMLANEIADKNEETEDNNGYNVFSVAVSGNNAVVSFETVTDATLLVAIYNESCDTLIATGTTEVTNGETEKNVILDTNDMPQYFYVKGYLIDTTTNKPLCTAYSSPMYTKNMQEFLSKTTDDFEENKVLNFDNDDDNNFAVYKDEVKLVDESGETNKVTKSDDTTKTYVIENIDDSISSLSEGDIFSYDYSNGDALIVKVASIAIDGTTATITGEDANLDDVFDYVKIDSTAKKSDFTYDESTVGEGVSILSEQKSRKSRAIDISGSASWSVPFSVSYVDNGVNVKGSLTYGSSVYVKVYLSIQYQYLELKVDQTLKLDLSVSTNLFESSIDLFEFGVSPIAGVYVTVTPALVIEGSINCSISATMKTTNGFSVSNTEGYKDLTTNPKLETKLDFSGSVFIGAKATLKIRVLGSLVEGGFTLKNGVDISGKFDDTKDSSSKKHNCSACIKGDIYKKIGGSIYIKFLNSKNLKFELSLNVKTKISDFYYSLDHQTFDFTTCPYVSYKVNIIVKNSNGSFVSGASVNGTATTDSDGKVTMYLPNGNHTFTASYNGQTESTTTTVNNAETTAEIVIGTSQSNPDYDFSSAGEIVQVAAGGTHTAAVTKDGDLYMWGRNYYGQLGVYSNADSKIPIKVNNSSSTLPEKSVKYIALGYYHSAAITKDGSLYMWGYNRSGQLGDGTTTDRYTPVKIMDNVASVSLGGSHSAAVTKDGSLYMWGDNGNGRLGDGTTTDRYTPVKIMDNVASVSLGSSHSAAITKDGSLYMWGYNYYGQLGDGTTTDRYTPVKIMDNVASVSLGGNHSAAITKDSNLYMWGGNGSGQLGDGTTDNKTRPHRVASNVQSVKLGYIYTTVISKDGGLYTWGYNYYGQLGNGTTTNSSNPIKIMNDAIDCAGGDDHTIVLKKDGTVYTWGYNDCGQLGDSTTTNRTSPVAIQIYDHTNVLTSSGIKYGIIPDNGNYSFESTGEVIQMAAGGTHTAAVTKDGDLYMWGRNYYGQLGVYSNADSKIPIKVNNSSSTLPEKSVKYIALGYYHSAAITKDGSLYMWGYNRSGQLGDGTTTDRYTPVKIMDNVASVSLGGSHSAAVTKDGSLYMWGDNGNGRLGDGTTTDRYTPVKIMDNVASVSLGSSHSAAITKDGSLYMWGYNYYGQLGDGTTTDRYTPVKIMDNVASVSLGGNHSAAITKDSNLYMWGGNGSGQLGDGTTDNKTRPHRVASNVQSVKLGYIYTTVISKDGGLYTWGYNYYGQLGNGTTTNSSNPIKIMNDAIDCAGGDDHTIVLKKDGTVYTWGYNDCGQLGDGTTTDRTSPVAIQIYDHTNVLKSAKKSSELVSASSGQHTSKFAGYNANGIYNFYALKDKNADKLLSDDNILYVDQVRADANGNISVTYTPKTAYDSPYEFVASITQVNISNADVSAEDFTYNGKLQTVEPVVKVNGYTLYSGIDYTLSGAYIAKNAGEYTYTINGKGDFTGSITKTFTIKTADMNNCDVLIPDSATYTGKDIEPNAVVKIGDVTLEKDVDYTVEYQNNLNVGIGIVVIKGKGNCSSRKVCWFDITNCDISEISKIDIQNCAYYGKAVVPEMVLENNGTSLVKDKDYTVTFKNNDSVGTATAVINGIGNYSGTIEKTFQIKLPIGDIDMSETIDVKDATLVMQYGVKLIDLSDEQLIIADVNNDNIVNIKDATMIQKYLVNLIDSFIR